jgi:hypothetical protein
MSDHGMTPVTHHFDLIGFLTKRGFKFGNHYIAFVGATYTSFWFKNEQYKEKIVNELSCIEAGQFLNAKDKINLGINEIGMNFHGEEIFAAKEHYVFFPEFYHVRRPPKGMHGYTFSEYDMPIFLMNSDVISGPGDKMINFTHIMPTILNLLDLLSPSSIQGKSIL